MRRTSTAAAVTTAVLALSLTSAPAARAAAPVKAEPFSYAFCWWKMPYSDGYGGVSHNLLQIWNPVCWYAWVTNADRPNP